MIDYSRFPYHKKPYADSTLMQMTKKELVEIIRDYEHNYSALYDTWKISVRQSEELLKEAGVIQ